MKTPLRVVFLGTGAGSLTDRMGLAILLMVGQEYLLVDAGYGANVQLVRAGIDLCRVKVILVTHHHIDHCGGLPSIFHDLKAHGCLEPITIYVPPEAEEPVKTLIRLFGPRIPPPHMIEVVEAGQRVEVGAYKASFMEAVHPLQTLSPEISVAGLRILYSSDTAPYPEFKSRAKGADLCIHEATLPDHMAELSSRFGHSTVSQAIKTCKDSRRTALVHLTTLSESQLASLATSENLIVPQDLDELLVPSPRSSF